nr:hypothetical protein CFP56_64136 [Quercus suber]
MYAAGPCQINSLHSTSLTVEQLILSCRENVYVTPEVEPSPEDDEDIPFTVVLVMSFYESTAISDDIVQLGRMIASRSVHITVTRRMRAADLTWLAKVKVAETFALPIRFPVTLQSESKWISIPCDDLNCRSVLKMLQHRVRQGRDAELFATLVDQPWLGSPT